MISMRTLSLALTLTLALALPLTAASAQGGRARQRVMQPQGRIQPDGPPGQPGEAQVRQAFARAVKQRLGLSDEQMKKLEPVAREQEKRRREHQRQERDARLALGDLMQDDSTADQAKVAQSIDRLVALERARAELTDREQKELAAIMTPLQRARYMSMQERVRNRLMQLRQARPGQPGQPGSPGADGMGPP
ncbi:MAG: hypothetical protein JWO05_3215 [Gemmatimonadetes bacterium]|nr:hypothetical protein [Gemmatimonadota bacterium]